MDVTMRASTEPREVSLDSLNKQVGRLFEMQKKTAKVVEQISEERGLFVEETKVIKGYTQYMTTTITRNMETLWMETTRSVNNLQEHNREILKKLAEQSYVNNSPLAETVVPITSTVRRASRREGSYEGLADMTNASHLGDNRILK